jgi:hypothetical protein
MKKLVLILLLVSITYPLTAQRFDFGRVSDNEVKEKSHPKDSDAAAAILYKKVNTKLIYEERWFYLHEVEVRLKIYNPEGYKYATVDVPLYLAEGNIRETILNIRANTYNYENGNVERERLRNAGKFEEEYIENWNIYRFTLPSVKSGSVLEYTYQIKSPFIESLPEVKFQGLIPYNYVQYVTEIPHFFGYKIFQKGYEQLDMTQQAKVDNVTLRQSTQNRSSRALGVGGATTGILEFTTVSTKYTAQDVAAFKNESFVNNPNNYTSSLQYELSWAEVPGNNRTNYSQTWDDVAKSIYDNKRFGVELRETSYYEFEVAALVRNESDLLKRIDLILQFLKNKVKWNGRYGYFTREGVVNAYNTRSGNVAEINLMLTSMLRSAGLNANPVLLSTKSNGIALNPTRTGFNYVICAVEINNQTILLDATEEFSGQNLLPERALNWYGRIIRNNYSTDEVNLMPSVLSRNIINLNVDVHEDGIIKGRVRNAYTDNLALEKRILYNKIGKNNYEEHLENVYQNLDILSVEIQNENDINNPFIETYSFNGKNSYDKIGGTIYLSPLFFFTTSTNPFIAEERKFPIDFSFPKSISTTVTINLPDGYSVDFLPDSSTTELPDNLGMFSLQLSQNENSIQVRYSYQMRSSMVSSEYYLYLKDFFNKIIEQQSQKIILKKDV